MRRRLLSLAAALLLASAALAQTTVKVATSTEELPLAVNWDLDAGAADDAAIVATADLLDSTTFTIAAQPDACRLVDATVVDANSSIIAGTVTVTGTDCLGYARVCTFDFSVVATRGSGVKTLPVTTGPASSSCYLRAVTSVVSSALNGEGGAGIDTISVGYTTVPTNSWAMYGRLKVPGPNGEHAVDPRASLPVLLPITTSGTSTTVTSVGSASSFANVAVGDLLDLVTAGVSYEVKVTARASANSITVSRPLTLPTAGVPFRLKTFYVSTDPLDRLWVDLDGAKSVTFTVDVQANADTGGVINTFECGVDDARFPSAGTVVKDTDTTTSGSASRTVYSLILSEEHYRYCRMGERFGTNDDADAGAPEDISIRASVTY